MAKHPGALLNATGVDDIDLVAPLRRTGPAPSVRGPCVDGPVTRLRLVDHLAILVEEPRVDLGDVGSFHHLGVAVRVR